MYYCLSQPYCQTTSKVKDDSIYHWPIQYNNEKNEDSPKENIWLATSSKESTTTRYYTQDLNRCSIIHVFPPFPIKFSPKEDYWIIPVFLPFPLLSFHLKKVTEENPSIKQQSRQGQCVGVIGAFTCHYFHVPGALCSYSV